MKRLVLIVGALLVASGARAQQTPSQATTPTHVICDSGCGGAVSTADGTTFTISVSPVNLIGGAFNDTPPSDLTGSVFAAPRITKQRGLHTNIRTASGVEVPFPAALGGSGGFKIECLSGCGGAASFSDNSAFTAGTTSINVSGGVFNDGLSGLTSGNAGSPRMTAFRAFHFNLRDNSGNEVGTAANPLQVDGSNGVFPTLIDNLVRTDLGVSQNGVTANNTGTPITVQGNGGVVYGVGILEVNCASCAGGTTVNFEGSADGSNWFALYGRLLTSGTAPTVSSSTTTAGITHWEVSVGAVNNVRTTVTAYSAGTVTTHLFVQSATGTQTTYVANAAIPATQSGTWTVAQGGAGGTAWPFKIQSGGGATFATVGPSSGALYANLRDDSGNELGIAARPVQVSLANTAANATAVKVDGSAVTQPVSGTVTANAGTNLNTSLLALESGGNLATVAGTAIAQEATTSGVKGVTAFGAVTTNAPTYVTAKSDALSLDTAGNLRVSLKDTPSNTNNLNVNLAASAATVTVSGTVTTTPPSNASTNVAQFGGVNVSTGTGASGTGIPRVTVANDSNILATQSGTWTVQPGNTANTTPWLTSIVGSGNTASVNASNQLAVNCANCSGSGVSQQDATGFTLGSGNMVPTGGVFNDTPTAMTSGTTGVARMNAYRVPYSIPTDTYGNPDTTNLALLQQLVRLTIVEQQRANANPLYMASGTPVRLTTPMVTPDPCSGPKGNIAISQTANTRLATNAMGRRLAICSIFLVGADAENLALVEGSGSTCGTGTAGVIGGSSAANGPNLAANGGFTLGNGTGTIAVMATAGNDLCLFQSGAGRVAGNLTYVYQ